MLEVSGVKQPQAAISPHRGEQVLFLGKMNIVDFLVMGN